MELTFWNKNEKCILRILSMKYWPFCPGIWCVNWLSIGRCGCDCKCLNFKHNLRINILNIQIGITLELMPESLVDGKPAVQVLAWCRWATSHYFNSLRPSDTTIWRHRSRSTLAQVMTCCLTAPSHYLNQCWLIISKVLQHSPEGNFAGNAPDIYHWYDFEND